VNDSEWLNALPVDAEFLTPAGACGGLFPPENPGGLRCRVDACLDGSAPDDGRTYAFVDFWASGQAWVPVAILRTWERYER
jgi:hypothetical protein